MSYFYSSKSCRYVFLLAVAASLSGCAVNPEPARSAYVCTATGGFAYHKDTRVWTVELTVKLLQRAPGGGPLYLEAYFQNPMAGGKALTVESNRLVKFGDSPAILLETSPVTGMQDNKVYIVVVSVYADKAHTVLLDTLRQGIKYHYVSHIDTVLPGSQSKRTGTTR